MTPIVFGLVIVINIFASINFNTNKKKKVSIIILFFSFIFDFLLMSGYRNTSGFSNDLMYNEIEFNNIAQGINSNYEKGYILLNKIGSLFTNDFYIFRSVIIFIFLGILFLTIIKWASSPHYVIALFSSYLIILSAEQLRYYLAFTIFCIGISVLVYSESKWKKLIYCCYLLIASSIHMSFLIYFVFLINNGSRKGKLTKIIFITTLLICVAIFLNGNQIPGISELLINIDNYKVNVYLSQSTNLGFLYPFLLHFLSITLAWWALKLSKRTQEKNIISHSSFIYKINLLATIFFPLYMMQITFYRLARNLLIVNYFLISEVRVSKDISYTNRKVFVVVSWFTVLLWFVVDLLIKTPSKSLLVPFFTENIFFNF